MKTPINRRTVDLSEYPDLVVVYLGMPVRAFRGLKTLFGLGPQIQKAGEELPDGLLRFENNIIFSFFPLHLGMRWYWQDFESLEKWTRSEPHRTWWKDFLKDAGGTGFWHETYFNRGGMEAIYDDIKKPLGFSAFAECVDAKGSMFSARRRLGIDGETPAQPDGTTEGELES